MGETINIMSGFANFGKDGKIKGVIRIQSEDLIFNPDDKAAAQQAADAILETIKERLLQGLAPDGQALPPLKPSTLERRAVEERQGARGGQAHPRFHDAEFRTGVAKRYRRDYTARSGSFVPVAEHPRGEVSGLLIESMVARGDRSGKGVTIYVAAKRGRPRPALTGRPQEAQSALESVLAGAPIISPQVMQAPKIRKRLGEMLKGMIGKPKDLKKNLVKLLKASLATAEEVQATAEDLENDAE